jgi:hypothetical protein
MTPREYVAQEYARIIGRLDEIRPEFESLQAQLVEMEATQCVLDRFAEANKTSRSAPQATATEGQSKGRGRPQGSRNRVAAAPAPEAGKPPLGEAILRVVRAHEAGATPQSIATGLLGVGMQARPNHIGIALSRHAKAGRLVEKDGLWYDPDLIHPAPKAAAANTKREDRPAA